MKHPKFVKEFIIEWPMTARAIANDGITSGDLLFFEHIELRAINYIVHNQCPELIHEGLARKFEKS